MIWNFWHNGFHGRTWITLRVPAGSKEGDLVSVSYRVAKRLDDACCGGSGACTCGETVTEHGVSPYDDRTKRFWIELPIRGGEMCGRYPQG